MAHALVLAHASSVWEHSPRLWAAITRGKHTEHSRACTHADLGLGLKGTASLGQLSLLKIVCLIAWWQPQAALMRPFNWVV